MIEGFKQGLARENEQYGKEGRRKVAAKLRAANEEEKASMGSEVECQVQEAQEAQEAQCGQGSVREEGRCRLYNARTMRRGLYRS